MQLTSLFYLIRYKLSIFFFNVSEWLYDETYCKKCESCGEPGCCENRCIYFKTYLVDYKNQLQYIKEKFTYHPNAGGSVDIKICKACSCQWVDEKSEIHISDCPVLIITELLKGIK